MCVCVCHAYHAVLQRSASTLRRPISSGRPIRRLTEVATKEERLSSGTPLQAVDTSVRSSVDAELLIAACELVHSAFLVVLDVAQQLLETTVSAHGDTFTA